MRPDVPLESFLKMAGTIVAVIAWLAAAAKKRAGHGRPAPAPLSDEAERTRRVREEVQRKIAARQREEALGRLGRYAVAPSLPPAASPAAARESLAEEAEEAVLTAPVRAEEQRLAEQVRAMRAAQAETEAVFTPYTPPAIGAAPESPWLTELRQPGGARRAILLREILGPPLALR